MSERRRRNDQIIALAASGLTSGQIARKMRITRSAASGVIKRRKLSLAVLNNGAGREAMREAGRKSAAMGRHPWTDDEDAQLIRLIAESGFAGPDWHDIGDRMNRTHGQVRVRAERMGFVQPVSHMEGWPRQIGERAFLAALLREGRECGVFKPQEPARAA